MITKISARSFKSLRSFDIAPKRVNLLIGANGTGKTNFADLIAFLAGVARRGLPETIGDFGGLSQVRTRSSKGAPYKLQISIHIGEDRSRSIGEVDYSFELTQSKEIKVHKETLKAVVYDRPLASVRSGGGRAEKEQEVEIHFRREGSKITDWSDSLGRPAIDLGTHNDLLLANPFLRGLRIINNYIGSWRVYNIDPYMSKQSLGGEEIDLRRDGSNIVSFVSNTLKNRTLRQDLLHDLQEVVPYIDDIETDRLLTLKTLRIIEKDTKNEFQLPEISDGTIRLLGLLAILNQRLPAAVIVIEEPENALHTYAIHRFLARARRAAMKQSNPTQMFFTSHSPVVVDELLSLDALAETDHETACFVTQRKRDTPSIIPAPPDVMQAIVDNLGRPSDFQREGSFGDQPVYFDADS